MADCLPGIGKAITSNCTTQPVAGTQAKAWVGNRTELAITYDVTNLSKITNIVPISGAQLYPMLSVGNGSNPGHDGVFAPNRATRYAHKWSFEGFEFDCASVENIDALEDLVVIVEMRNNPADADGTFRAFGVKQGLYKTSDSWSANDVDGARPIEMASLEGAGEKYSNYTVLDATGYATTRQMLVDGETPTP